VLRFIGVVWRSHRTAASRGSMRERRPRTNCNAESLARGSPAGGAGKALGVAGISTNRSQNGEREDVTLPEAIRRLIRLGFAASRPGKKAP
jgi:hypothetical protein